jgi:hypothetical protein
MPPHPILSLLADDCGSYHHLTSDAPSPFRAHAGIAAAIPAVAPSTCHHPFVARMPMCASATLSHHVSCGALWHPIITAHCSASTYRCSSRDAHARSSMMKPHAACPAGRPDASESVPSRPLHSVARHTCSHIARVRWRPSLCHVDT